MIGSVCLLDYYFLFGLGILMAVCGLFILIGMIRYKTYPIVGIGKMLGCFLLGSLMLAITLPSLKYMLLKDYDVVKGACAIDMYTGGKTADADIIMLENDELFTFDEIPELEAYGKAIPYYCEVTVTKDHNWGINYKIFDAQLKKLLVTSK